MTLPKIGAVSYLNTKPLVFGLEALTNQCSVIYDLPSRLADRLANGELDVALIPSIEATSDPGYVIVSDACIGCRGPVWSVKLLSKVQPDQIKTLALDEGSRTSAALIKILLGKRHGVRPDFLPLAIESDWRQIETDAVLLIGDRAMNPMAGPFTYSWDLGKVWNEWTGLPFVFAMWTARESSMLDKLNWLLTQARDKGIQAIAGLANSNAPKYNLTVEQAETYLADHLHFYLGQDEKAALEKYFQFAAELDLIPHDINLNFYECQTQS